MRERWKSGKEEEREQILKLVRKVIVKVEGWCTVSCPQIVELRALRSGEKEGRRGREEEREQISRLNRNVIVMEVKDEDWYKVSCPQIV